MIFLSRGQYLVQHKERYILTAKFNQEVLGLDIGITVADDVVVKETDKATDWVKTYQDFILAIPIPKYSTSGKGETYEINRATKPGREAYKKAIESGVTNDTLLAAAKAYYKKGSYRVKVEKFFVDEHWRSVETVESNSRSTDGNFITKPNLG